MTIFLGLSIGTIILYLLFLQILEMNELTRTQFRFRYFTLRDELAMLVIKGKVDEHSWEYQQIIRTLNFHISAVESLSFLRIVDVIAGYHLSAQEAQKVQKLKKNIDNEEVRTIVRDYLSTTYDLISRNSRIQIALFKLILTVTRRQAAWLQMQHTATNPSLALMTIKDQQAVFSPA